MATFARICKEIKDRYEVTILFICLDTKTSFPNNARLLLALSIECQVDEDSLRVTYNQHQMKTLRNP